MATPWAVRLLLAVAWSVDCGEAFRCYSCERPSTMSSCKNVTLCKQEDTACKTTLVAVESEYPFNQSPLVLRSCSSSCLATDPDSIGVSHPVFCCFHDLCNSAGVAGLGTGALAVPGAAFLRRLLP